MEGAQVGIWCAHGEGRAVFPDPAIMTQVVDQQLAPIRYAHGIASAPSAASEAALCPLLPVLCFMSK